MARERHKRSTPPDSTEPYGSKNMHWYCAAHTVKLNTLHPHHIKSVFIHIHPARPGHCSSLVQPALTTAPDTTLPPLHPSSLVTTSLPSPTLSTGGVRTSLDRPPTQPSPCVTAEIPSSAPDEEPPQHIAPLYEPQYVQINRDIRRISKRASRELSVGGPRVGEPERLRLSKKKKRVAV